MTVPRTEPFAFRCGAGKFKVGPFKQLVHGDFWSDLYGRLPPATAEVQLWLFWWSVPNERWVPLRPHDPLDQTLVGRAGPEARYLSHLELEWLDEISEKHGRYVHHKPEAKEET